MCLSCQLHANPVSAVIWKPFPEILLKMHLGIHIHIHLRVDEQNLPKVIGGKKINKILLSRVLIAFGLLFAL